MIKVILICVVLYIIWLDVYFIWSYYKTKRTSHDDIIVKTHRSNNIMGKTKDSASQIQPIKAIQNQFEKVPNKHITFNESKEKKYSQIVSDDELESVFDNNKMDIDLEIENIEDEITQESLPCFDDYDHLPNEVGVEYGEIENLAMVVANKEMRPEKLKEASETAYKVNNTELLDAIINGYENGLQKVSEMIAKHEAMQMITAPKIECFEDFKLINFL